MDEYTAAGHTQLACENRAGFLEHRQNRLRISIVEDQMRGLAAELEPDALEMLGAGLGDGAPGCRAAGETDDRHLR